MMKRILPLLPLSLACASVLHAQALFVVETKQGEIRPVVAAFGVTPEVSVNGKLEEVHNSKSMVLKRAASYSDGFIKFDDFRIDPKFTDSGMPDETNFSLKGTLTSDRTLTNCFLLLVFEAEPGNPPTLLVAQVPDLDAGVRTLLRLNVPQDPTLHLQERNYMTHFFSGMGEHVTSIMPEADQVIGQAKTDSEILKNTESRKLGTLLTIRPERPAGADDNVAGNAVVRCRIDTSGLVTSASLISATPPEFGANAVHALQQWIFIPAIKHHEYVETTVDVPLQFRAANAAAAAH